MTASGWRASWSAICSSRGFDLGPEAGQVGDERVGDRSPGGGLGAAGADRCVLEVVPEPVQVGKVVVAGRAQPGPQSRAAEPVGLVLAGKADQEGQTDRGVDVAEQADRAREARFLVRAELVGHPHPSGDQVLAGAYGHRQGEGLVAVTPQRPEPGPVGAQHVGQHVGVEPVVLVARRPVARTEVLDLVRRDHEHLQTGGQQRLDDGAVRSFDRHTTDPGTVEPPDQAAQPRSSVRDGEPVTLDPGSVDDGDRVIGAGPIDPRGRRRFSSSRSSSMLISCPSSLSHQQVGHPRRFGTRPPVAH
jgi:hypothetical protein